MEGEREGKVVSLARPSHLSAANADELQTFAVA